MQKMKKESGITMTVLVITIIVLGIIGAVLISYSVVGTKETKNKKYLANLQVVQHALYERYEQYKVTNDASILVGESTAKPSTSFEWADNNAYWSKNTAGERYYKLDADDLKELGISNIDDTEYIVNYYTQEVYDLTHRTTSSGNDLYNMGK